MTDPDAVPLQTLTIEDFDLESGDCLERADIRYRTYGNLSKGADNCVVAFTYYTGNDLNYQPWIGAGKALDPRERFVVVVNHLGNGVSSSPSNTPGKFPSISIGDSSRAATKVLDHLSVQHVELAVGWSLGGMQSLEFAIQNAGSVSAVLALCSAARCAETNQVFLESVGAALRADPRFAECDSARPPLAGLDAFGRVYAGWAYSEAFFSEGIFRELGYQSPSEVLADWGYEHQQDYDAQDLMATLMMWRSADLGRGRGGLASALGSLTARTILMPSETDSYFTVAENQQEVSWLPHGELRIMETPLGHMAGRPGIRAQEQDDVDAAMRELLEPETTQP